MQMRETIIENGLISMLCEGFTRSPLQVNELNKSDAEIVSLPGTKMHLAFTTDNIVEEIESGLYDDPYLIGWMTVIVNASDIAAVGAEPLGLLLSETLSDKYEPAFIEEIQRGISDACKEAGFFVLGGDTNFSHSAQFGAAAMGLITDNNIITREGCEAGDIVYISGRAGIGSAYAFAKLSGFVEVPVYKPEPRIAHGKIIRQFASCCMDTSDGFLSTLDQLMRINKKGFLVNSLPAEYISGDAIEMSSKYGLSPLLMLAGQHGEFELIFTVPPDSESEFLKAAELSGWKPLKIGVVTEERSIKISDGNNFLCPDTTRLRNLLHETKGDLSLYMRRLTEIFAGPVLTEF